MLTGLLDAVLKAAESQGSRLTKGRVASVLDVTTLGIHMVSILSQPSILISTAHNQ
jgi:hypothetical protein